MFREWKTQVNIPVGSPDPVYRAFLEMMWRVGKLANIPADAAWAVEAFPGYDQSDEVLKADHRAVRLHVLRATWGDPSVAASPSVVASMTITGLAI
jgi:hypothetical protein